MTRFIFPIILLLAAIGLFVVYTNPNYQDMGQLKTAQQAYNQALNNSQQLLKVRNDLTTKYNNMSQSDQDKLTKLMPDSVDNIRLIIDIQNIALAHGMSLNDIKYDANAGSTGASANTAVNPSTIANNQKDYGSFDLQFSVAGSYASYLSFLNDIEQSLRLVDIESVTFQAPNVGSSTMKYVIRIRTYWLKS